MGSEFEGPPDLTPSDPSVYVAHYIRNVLIPMDEKREALVKSLLEHRPFVETEFMAVAMIDISGFSSLTSLFSDMLGLKMKDVWKFKFLGDALLVTLSSNKPN
ncbi:hypothetical protein BC829DRAFT_435326 [Chytridium lagenaria]|nr:hypothetical protein BC829DRAFT_435326 [Chytridium lagenaria]